MLGYQRYGTVFLLVLLFGCEEPFTPKGPYEQKLAVVGILSTTSDTQYVRVFKTYDPQGFNPYEVLQDQAVRGATVTVARGGSVVQYQETMVARTDTSRFRDNIVAYSAHPFRVQPGRTYSLDVVTPSDGNIHSSTTAPDTGWISVLNPFVLSLDRVLRGEGGLLAVQAMISPSASAYMLRFYLDFDVRRNSSWVPMRIEIPAWVIFIDTTRYFGYPKLRRRTSTPGPPGTWQPEGAYLHGGGLCREVQGPDGSIFKRRLATARALRPHAD